MSASRTVSLAPELAHRVTICSSGESPARPALCATTLKGRPFSFSRVSFPKTSSLARGNVPHSPICRSATRRRAVRWPKPPVVAGRNSHAFTR